MKILVGYDSAKNFSKALDLARKHAVAFNAHVTIFTATAHSPELNTDEISTLKSNIEAIQKDFQKNGISCETHIAYRSLSQGEDLVEFAKENEIDEIIIGVKHRSKIGKLIMGSTAQYVILEAHCPVVTVK
jgi:nucleotide-binding universal stress UspA family protein